MSDASTAEPAAPARLLLIETGDLADALAPPLAAALSAAPAVVAVRTGRDAIELLRAAPFDLVAADADALADLSPDLDGRIARLARASGGGLVLLLAADPSVSAAMAAMRAGAHDCLDRMSDAATVARRLCDLARRHGKAHLLGIAPTGPATDGQSPSIPVMRDLVLPMWRQEQRIIEDAIQSFAGNIALAAAALELSPSTIYRKRQAWAEMQTKRA
jgi:DNA-binding NtrC family response regulator